MSGAIIVIAEHSGPFGGDKDAAADVRERLLKPALRVADSDEVVLDFNGVEYVTQSFVHALLSSIVRKDPKSLETMRFDNCTESVREIIDIVIQYSQEDLGDVVSGPSSATDPGSAEEA